MPQFPKRSSGSLDGLEKRLRHRTRTRLNLALHPILQKTHQSEEPPAADTGGSSLGSTKVMIRIYKRRIHKAKIFKRRVPETRWALY